MRYVIFSIFIVISVISLAGTPQRDDNLNNTMLLDLFVRPDIQPVDTSQYNEFKRQYISLIDELKIKQKTSKSESAFLKAVFYTVHKKMLIHYKQYVSFHQIFGRPQQYDCVTGTALYAIILRELGFTYQIHETDYHVYLVAQADGKSYMFESTDPLNGFVWRSAELTQRETLVNKTSMGINAALILDGVSSNDTQIQQPHYINNIIDLYALSGLHYYNQALRHFNDGNYKDAHRMIIIAQGLHPTQRIKYASSYFFAMAFEE